MWIATHISDSEKNGNWIHCTFFKTFVHNKGLWFFFLYAYQYKANTVVISTKWRFEMYQTSHCANAVKIEELYEWVLMQVNSVALHILCDSYWNSWRQSGYWYTILFVEFEMLWPQKQDHWEHSNGYSRYRGWISSWERR